MPDDVKPPVDDTERTGGPLPPYCYQNESGLCKFANLKAWSEFDAGSASSVWQSEGVPAQSEEDVRAAGEDAARIQSGAEEAETEAQNMKLCDHCPWRLR